MQTPTEAEPPGQPANRTAALFAARLLCILFVSILAAHLMGCGGGGDESPCYVDLIRLPDGRLLLAPHSCLPNNPAVPTPTVHCTAHPELCK